MDKSTLKTRYYEARPPSSDELADSLRKLAEVTQLLAGATGFKGLLRRFAEAIAPRLGVERIAFAKISGKGAKLTLKRRAVRTPALATYEDEEILALGAALGEADVKLPELREGVTTFRVGGVEHLLTVIDDPQARDGCLVVWRVGERSDRLAGDAGQAAARAFDELYAELIVKQLQNEARWFRKLDKTQAMLYRDDLTGLYNQRYLEIVLDAELRRADRFQAQFCLLFIDMDGFKPVNDQHGHLSGSSVLKQVAEVIREAVREVDIPIRYGGDEFVVILLGASCSKGMLAAERVRRRIEQKEFLVEGGAVIHLTASLGLAAYPDHGADRETLLRKADETMYDSKRSGKNRVTIVGGQPLPAGAASGAKTSGEGLD